MPIESNPLQDLEERRRHFGRLLSQTRYNMPGRVSTELIASRIGVSKGTITSWENGNSFPEEEKLLLIAAAYRIEEKELREAYGITQSAREQEKAGRRPATPRKIDRDNEVFIPDGIRVNRRKQ